jgi:hypothetical protein
MERITQKMELLIEQRRRPVPLRTMPAKWLAASNVRSLSVYVKPSAYDKGVKIIARLNKCYLKRDPERFKRYVDVYGNILINNEVARFRAKKKILSLYGDFIDQIS